uniref:Uncharacterized protein n=1 Tax=Geobacter sp. (strain M21) TaxID=443144 RepID=C6E2C9_GEOSM
MKTICPFCDSYDVEKIQIDENFAVPFCGDAVISHPSYRCNSCGEEGDFDNSLDKELIKAIDRVNSSSAPKLMDDLTQAGITMTYLEKALRLPFRTTARWRKGRISHSSLALLRLIRFSPSLLQVADENFSPEVVAKYQISRPWDFFERNTGSPIVSYVYDENQFGISFKGNVHLNAISSVQREVKWEHVK